VSKNQKAARLFGRPLRVTDGSRRADTLLSERWPRASHADNPQERRHALELLAPCRDGCTETTMLAHGFSIDMLVELINSGLATVQNRVLRGQRLPRGKSTGTPH
jgi:hypothetical protein